MDAAISNDVKSKIKYRFKERSEAEIKELLDNKDKKNTQRATNGALRHFNAFLESKQLPKIEGINDAAELASILEDFYIALKPIKENDYSAQSIKCIRSAINRYTRKEKGIDICHDPRFTKANERFASVLVESKKKGKGVKIPTTPISTVDFERICEYFCYDHMQKPDPRHLQQQIIFYVIYYFCRRGRENLYGMEKDMFCIETQPEDGVQYIVQAKDEMDKNHGINDTTKNKTGRMYNTGGELKFRQYT